MNCLQLRTGACAALALGVLALPAVAFADEAMEYLQGDYRVTETGKGSGQCRFSLVIEPDVGGQIMAAKECEKSLPEIMDAARWSPDDGSGFRLFDALRKPIAHGVEDEAGYVLILPDDRRLAVEAIDTQPPVSPNDRTVGKWTLYLKSDEPGRHVCKVEFRVDHTIAAPTCGPRWPIDKSSWNATEKAVRIAPKKARQITLQWLDAATLGAAGGDWAMVKE